jgi:hypothetical protein
MREIGKIPVILSKPVFQKLFTIAEASGLPPGNAAGGPEKRRRTGIRKTTGKVKISAAALKIRDQ